MQMNEEEAQKTSPFEPLLPELLTRLQDPDGFDWLTWYDLWDAGYRPTAAAEAILHILSHHQAKDRRKKAAKFLGRLGRTVRGANPALCQALQDKAAEVRQEAARALDELAAKEAAPALQTALKDRHPDVRRAVAEALFSIDPAAILAEAKYWLARASHPDAQFRRKAVIALGQLWPSEEILQVLLLLAEKTTGSGSLPHRGASDEETARDHY